MLRRVIKQGHSTLTITLPKKWAKDLKIEAGDEVNIIEKGNRLFINTKASSELRKTEIDISNLNIPAMWKYFMGAYREGYTEIKVIFKPNQVYENPYKYFSTHGVDAKYEQKTKRYTPIEIIQWITNRFIGFEVIESHQDHCIIREITKPTSKEFDSSLKRLFILLQQMGTEVVEAIETNNEKVIRHTHDVDINLDKFHDYCSRVLNQNEFEKDKLIFSILYLLELIGDEFKSIANHLINDLKGKKWNNILPIAKLIQRQSNEFYKLYYEFSQDKVEEISKIDIETHFFLPKFYKKQNGKQSKLSDDELEIFNHFRRISKYINAATELRIEMEF